MKRRLFRLFLWLALCGGLLIPAFPDPPLQSGAYVQSVTQRSAVVAMIDPRPRSLSLAVTGPDGALVRALPLSAPRRRHVFVADGLEPGTAYRYALRDAGDEIVDGGGFATPPAADTDPFRFAVVGDSGGQPWWVWLQNGPLFYLAARYRWLPARSEPAAIGASMAESAPLLWLHVGDVVYPRGEHRHYGPGFFLPFADLLRSAPCYVALGNHDVMQDSGRQCLANFVLPQNELTGDERFYTFAAGPVRFVALDLNDFSSQPDRLAAAFLDGAFSDASEPWRIVFAHYPIWSASRQRDREDLIDGLLPELRRHRVDVMFVGHDHNYQRFGDPRALAPGEPLLIVTGGGGKSLYELVEHPRVAKVYGGYHFCRIDVAGAVIRADVVAIDGAIVDSFALDLRARAAANELDPLTDARGRRARTLLE